MVAWTQGFAPKPISIGHIWLGPPVLGYVSFGGFQFGSLLPPFGVSFVWSFLHQMIPPTPASLLPFTKIKSLPFLGPSRIHLDTSVSTKTALRGPL